MSLSKELIFLFVQFCHEEDLKRTAHMLEHETGVFFDMEYFEELVLNGNWDEAENYLSGFTRLGNDKISIKIYFEIRKQKFLEALDEHDLTRALDILVNDLKAFAISNEELYKEMTQLLTLDDFRKHASLSLYGDTLSARKRMMNELRSIIEADPLFQDKLKFPHMDPSRLRRLVNQSLNWQHLHCTYPQPDPDIRTLFWDHQCLLEDHPPSQSVENNPLPFQAKEASVSPSSCKETSTVTQSVVSDGPAVNLGAPTAAGSGFNYVTDAGDPDFISDTMPSGTADGLVSTTVFSDLINRDDDVPKAVQRVLSEASSTTSMDFHPVEYNLLLVGTSTGDIGLWDVSSGEKLFSRRFHAWKIKNISKTFLVALVKDPHVFVNRVSWSTDGSLFGVAFSKHLVHLYSYRGGSDVHKHLEIDAHVGGVNDLAFSKPNDLHFLITCGNDKLIQVWDVITGTKQYTFEGHGAPVYSVCPHVKERVHFILSISVNGEIKAWLYDNLGSRFTYDAPGHCCTRMAYSADSKRLFSSGTTKDGESFILEWEESEGYVKRSYKGLGKCSSGVVQFNSSKNQFLVAGDDHLIKVWDMDNTELLTTIDADGDLPACPLVRISKPGTLVAVTANHNTIKILANPFGHELLQPSENISANRLMVLPETLQKFIIDPISTAVSDRGAEESNSGTGSPGMVGDSADSQDMKPESPAQSRKMLEVSETEIKEPSHYRSLRLNSEVETSGVPGKSAKDCFNKLHSDHSTPPQPQTRLRSRKTNSPSFSLSTSTLLKPEEPVTKKPSHRKQSRHLAQKTVRQLLQKHYNVDQNYEADLFSVLESTMNPSTQALQKGLTPSTPEGVQKDSGYLKKCRERSSSAHKKKHLSRLSGSYGATLVSPPVLKPVKNKALHEKYIDLLHRREAKRRAAKVLTGKDKIKESCINIQKTDVIKAAKDALVSDAKDVIHQFHHVKVNGMSNFSDFDDDFVESDDYEVEDEH